MGLCKCPKRKTTSHFCFHHCVNVCEHCIVNNHTTCVVKSYTTWLKEASSTSSSVSASALCAVCQKQFVLTPKETENFTTNFNGFGSIAKTAIRLLCYHIVHARCLSVYVKKQIKEGNILKCPSCARPLWLKQQEQIQDSVDNTDDPNELSPVESHLYKHLLDHGNWWGQALITNKNMKDIENYLLEDEDDYEETADEESQKLLEDQSTLEFKPQFNVVSNNISPLTLAQTIQSTSSDNSYYNNYNNSESVHKKPDVTTISYRSNTHQTYQPIHHRQFNNNYGIDTVFAPLPQQPQQNLQQQQCLSVNITTAQGSDLSNRHTVTSCPPLLLNDDNNLNHDEEQLDPSSKYRPKKFNNQSWSLSYQRLIQYFCGTNNRAEDNNTTKIAAIIILCVIFIVVLLVAITSYTRSINEPFDNNSIDYAGDDQVNNGGPAAHLKSFNINNL